MILLESKGVEFILYQLDGPVRLWWWTYRDTKLAGVPSVTWGEFSKAFITQFIPRSLRDRLRDQFTHLKWGMITMSEYEMRFQELSRYAISILPIEEEQIHYFI